jgi:chromosome segregation ATPase
LEEVQRQVDALKERYLKEQSRLEVQTQDLQAAQTPVEQKIKSLTEALAFETKRREAVERLAVDAFKRRRELEAQLTKHQEAEKALRLEMEAADRTKQPAQLEAQLTENKQAQAQLRQELEDSQK